MNILAYSCDANARIYKDKLGMLQFTSMGGELRAIFCSIVLNCYGSGELNDQR